MSDNPLSTQMQALINYSNETTGESDTDLSAAVGHLVDGFGVAGITPIFEYTYTFDEDYTATSAATYDTGIAVKDYLPSSIKAACCAAWRVDAPEDVTGSENALLATVNAGRATSSEINFSGWVGCTAMLGGTANAQSWGRHLSLDQSSSKFCVSVQTDSVFYIQAGTYKFQLFYF